MRPLREHIAVVRAVVARFHLGVAYARTEGAKARVAHEQTLRLRPDFEGGAELKQLLTTLVYKRCNRLSARPHHQPKGAEWPGAEKPTVLAAFTCAT
jgi:hypothetical protein